MGDEAGLLPKTYSWACATDGSLSAEQKKLVQAGVRAGYSAVARGLSGSVLRHSRRGGDAPIAPDSKLARLAEEAASEQSPALIGHGYRTWLLGHALSLHDGVKLDSELFYVTSLLHDAGMMREVVGQDFTVRSGAILVDICERAGADESLGIRAADAAVAHATPGLAPTDNPEGFYVQSGAMADLAGLRIWDLPKGVLRGSYRAHPADGVHVEIPKLIRREAAQHPDGRFAILKRGGMDRLVALSPTRIAARRA